MSYLGKPQFLFAWLTSNTSLWCIEAKKSQIYDAKSKLSLTSVIYELSHYQKKGKLSLHDIYIPLPIPQTTVFPNYPPLI
jgi:hypothetical protein